MSMRTVLPHHYLFFKGVEGGVIDTTFSYINTPTYTIVIYFKGGGGFNLLIQLFRYKYSYLYYSYIYWRLRNSKLNYYQTPLNRFLKQNFKIQDIV